MSERGVLRLGEFGAFEASWREFGAKAWNLDICIGLGVRVPAGIALSADFLRQLVSGSLTSADEKLLLELSDWLDPQEGLVSIRSSELVFPTMAESVSGKYASVRAVPARTENVIDTIKGLKHGLSSSASGDAEGGSTFLVQKEVLASYSGFARVPGDVSSASLALWLVDGDLEPLMSGEVAGHSLEIPNPWGGEEWDEFWCEEAGLRFVERISFKKNIAEFREFFLKLSLEFGPCSVEWCVDSAGVWILQAQPRLHGPDV